MVSHAQSVGARQVKIIAKLESGMNPRFVNVDKCKNAKTSAASRIDDIVFRTNLIIMMSPSCSTVAVISLLLTLVDSVYVLDEDYIAPDYLDSEEVQIAHRDGWVIDHGDSWEIFATEIESQEGLNFGVNISGALALRQDVPTTITITVEGHTTSGYGAMIMTFADALSSNSSHWLAILLNVDEQCDYFTDYWDCWNYIYPASD